MARYALFITPAYGHVNPTLAVAQELVVRGEQVVYYLTEEFRTIIESTGSRLHPLNDELFQGMNPSTAPGGPGSSSLVELLPVHLQRLGERILPTVLENLQAEPVDCILYDPMCLWGMFAAEILHIPAVALHTAYAVNEKARPFGNNGWQESQIPHETFVTASQILIQLCKHYHLPAYNPFSLFSHREALNIVFLPRAFQPGGNTFDERFIFVGPSLSEQRDERLDFPVIESGQRPLLYISLGTVFNNWADFFNLCFEAFSDTEWQVVLALGSAVDCTQLQKTPRNFVVAKFVPQLRVLQHASIFVTHGGTNSVMESLVHGVPMIVVPQMLEQEVTARRVQELGLGIALDKNRVTVDMLRTAATQIVDDPQIHTRIQVMQKAISAAGGYQRAADAIIDFTRQNLVNAAWEIL